MHNKPMFHDPATLLFGGSFNPPHLAHFALVHAALSALRLERCDIIPSGQPWQKPHVAPIQHRLAMLRCAVQDDEQRWQNTHPHTPYPIRINSIETLEDQPSYTIDTLTRLHKLEPHRPLIWLIGSDQLTNFHTWRDWQGILKHAHLAVAQRAGHEVKPSQLSNSALREYYQAHHCTAQSEQWQTQSCGLFIEFSAPLMNVSSTHIRAQLKQATRLPELNQTLTKSVQNYLQEHNLYK